jgi:thymidylate synthase
MYQSNNIDDLYKMIIGAVIGRGEQVTARGLDFKEIRFETFVLTNPRARIVQNPARKLSKKFMAAEFIWIMSGQDSVDMIGHYNSRMKDFSDDGVSLHGAYGPRLRHWNLQHGDVDQLQNCMARLKADLYTRQAVMVILDPAIDFTVKTKDVPCNDLLHFMYRDGKLDLMTYVRSNDLFLGFPYDVQHWCLLQEMFASVLNVPLGNYYHIVGSMHIYNKDMDKMAKIMNTPVDHIPMEPMPKLENLSIINELSSIEKDYRCTKILDLHTLNQFWQRYAEFLRVK